MKTMRPTSVFRTPGLIPSVFYLNSLSEACLQEREEDSGDGDMVSRLGKTSILPTGVHRHASGDVAYWYLITLLGQK